MPNPFSRPGQWFKANLHTHSNRSDGEYSPQQLVSLYAENGYDVLALTDHRTLTDPVELDGCGMLLIPGAEYDGGVSDIHSSYHIVGLGVSACEGNPPTTDIREFIATVLTQAQLCFVAHPYWSSLTLCDLLELDGFIGVEVYNTTCHYAIGRGESAVHWDDLLVRGRRLWGLAVDDTHQHYPDWFGGWVMIRAAACDTPSILAALAAGDFYASSGPVIHDLVIEQDRLFVRCSEAQEVRVICPTAGTGISTARNGFSSVITEVELPLRETWEVFRLEIVDPQGRKAWSNPVFRDERPRGE